MKYFILKLRIVETMAKLPTVLVDMVVIPMHLDIRKRALKKKEQAGKTH